MESFLSGREKFGDLPKSDEESRSSLPEGALEDLQLPDSENTEMVEEEGKHGSRVSYVMEEGRVVKIVVTCSCGQVTEIDCKYEG